MARKAPLVDEPCGDAGGAFTFDRGLRRCGGIRAAELRRGVCMAARHGVRGALWPDGFKPSKRSAPRGERQINSIIFSRLGQNLCGQPSASPLYGRCKFTPLLPCTSVTPLNTRHFRPFDHIAAHRPCPRVSALCAWRRSLPDCVLFRSKA